MDMKYKLINYIIKEFGKEYPTTPTKRFEDRLRQSTEDDLYRLADAIQRFGVTSLKEAIL